MTTFRAKPRQGLDCDWVVTRDSRPRPALVRHVLKERDRRGPDVFELFDQFSPGSFVRVRILDRYVLVEARERILEPAREPESAAEEEALTIVDVVQDLADGPLARCIAVQALLFGDTLEKLNSLAQLVHERRHDVFAGYEINVLEVVVRCFGRLWSCHLPRIVAPDQICLNPT
jgi:hypothetical protein